jgi:hypothetical protein
MAARALGRLIGVLVLATGSGCDGGDGGSARVRIENDFENPEMAFQPPWTICKAAYLGVEFPGPIAWGDGWRSAGR